MPCTSKALFLSSSTCCTVAVERLALLLYCYPILNFQLIPQSAYLRVCAAYPRHDRQTLLKAMPWYFGRTPQSKHDEPTAIQQGAATNIAKVWAANFGPPGLTDFATPAEFA